MNVFWSLNVLVLLVVEGSICAPTANSNKSKSMTYYEAIRVLDNFRCNEPQLRSYYLVELMEGLYKDSSESVNLPVCVLVHRCDRHAGCCGTPEMTCAPVPEYTYYDKVEVTIRNLTHKENHRWIQVEQHGKCRCVLTSSLPDEKLPVVTFIDSPFNAMRKY